MMIGFSPRAHRCCNRFHIFGMGLALFFLKASPAFAKGVVLPGGRGGLPPPTSLTSYITRLYDMGLIIVGLAAFFALVYAGAKYIMSAGNASEQSDAKDRIRSAIYGIALLLFATLLFNTINPEILQQPFQ